MPLDYTGVLIQPLVWKDDSFKPLNWGITNSLLSYYLNNLNLLPNGAFTTGDELILNNATVTNNIVPSFNGAYLLILRAKAPLGEAVVSVTIGGSQNYYFFPFNIEYKRFVMPVNLSTSSAPISISINSTGLAFIDYIALADTQFSYLNINSLDYGGTTINLSTSFRTIRQQIPTSTDIVQQLGIASKSYSLAIPKVSKTVYNWLEYLEKNFIPVEFIGPTVTATGYLSSVAISTEWGNVGSVQDSTIPPFNQLLDTGSVVSQSFSTQSTTLNVTYSFPNELIYLYLALVNGGTVSSISSSLGLNFVARVNPILQNNVNTFLYYATNETITGTDTITITCSSSPPLYNFVACFGYYNTSFQPLSFLTNPFVFSGTIQTTTTLSTPFSITQNLNNGLATYFISSGAIIGSNNYYFGPQIIDGPIAIFQSPQVPSGVLPFTLIGPQPVPQMSVFYNYIPYNFINQPINESIVLDANNTTDWNVIIDTISNAPPANPVVQQLYDITANLIKSDIVPYYT